MINNSPEAKAHIANAPDNKTIGQLRAEVREMLRPAALWRKLHEIRLRHMGTLGRVDINTIADAVAELQHAKIVMSLRPVSELRHEAYAQFGRRANSGPYRWVMLWRDSGYKGTPRLEGIAGRMASDNDALAGSFIGYDGERITDSGEDPYLFSELPLGTLTNE